MKMWRSETCTCFLTFSPSSSWTPLSSGTLCKWPECVWWAEPAFHLASPLGAPEDQLWKRPVYGQSCRSETLHRLQRDRHSARWALETITLVWPNLYWVWSTSMDPRSFSEAFLLSMNCPSGIALAFKTLYLFQWRKNEWLGWCEHIWKSNDTKKKHQ